MKRKLNKRQKLCRNLLLILVFALLYLLLTSFWGYLTADQAHAASEMALNYGPSQIVQVVKDGNYRYYLGKYDRWFSCHPVYRTITGWRFGSQSLCDEIQPDKDINFGWMISSDGGRVWGVVNNPEIVSVEAEFSNGDNQVFLRQNQLYHDMFLLLYSPAAPVESNPEGGSPEGIYDDYTLKAVHGYDKDGALVYTAER